jgi:hypothetical protein
LLSGVVTSLGCNGGAGDAPETSEVTGLVTLDVQPLANAHVEFAPATGRPSFGETDAEGRYRLEYSPDQSGAIVGTNTVRIYTGGYGEAGPIPEKVPARYNEQTELKADVKPGTNEFNFDLLSE